MQEVSWPPTDPKAEEKINSIKSLPDLTGKVHLGRNRRQKLDLEIKSFQGSTAHYTSNPFSKGDDSIILSIVMCLLCRVFPAWQDDN